MASEPQWAPLPFSFVSAPEVLAAAIVLPTIGILLVALRIYTRRTQKQGMKMDDWLSIPAAIMLTGMGACLITGYALKVMGYPTPLPMGADPQAAARNFIESYEKVAKVEFAFQICQILTMGFVKLSVIYFCRRIFTVYKGSLMDWTTLILIIVNVCWTIGFLLTLIFGCKLKVWLHWSPLQTELISKECGDLRQPMLAAVISDFVLELIILVLPLPSIWGLQITRARKLGITGVFLLGLMSVLGSLIRMVYYIIVLKQPYDAGYDINQTVTTMLWWSMLQAALAVIASCLPTIYALRKHVKVASLASLGSLSWLRSTGKSASIEDTDNSLEKAAKGPRPMDLQEVVFSQDGKILVTRETHQTRV